jgi:hypothetical protein
MKKSTIKKKFLSDTLLRFTSSDLISSDAQTYDLVSAFFQHVKEFQGINHSGKYPEVRGCCRRYNSAPHAPGPSRNCRSRSMQSGQAMQVDAVEQKRSQSPSISKQPVTRWQPPAVSAECDDGGIGQAAEHTGEPQLWFDEPGFGQPHQPVVVAGFDGPAMDIKLAQGCKAAIHKRSVPMR